jgi:phosphotransferase system HPr (HPr) family protein
MNDWIIKRVALNRRHLHMRPTQRIVDVARLFRSDIRAVKDSFVADAKSILEMIELAGYMITTTGSNKFTFQAMGDDSRQAVEALSALVKEINKATAEKSAGLKSTYGQESPTEASP